MTSDDITASMNPRWRWGFSFILLFYRESQWSGDLPQHFEPIRNQDYINVQIGEASVANPAPGVTTEQIVYDRVRDPNFTVLARSSLTRGEPILTESEVRRVSCLVNQIEAHFQEALDPNEENRWFAIDAEFKLVGDDRNIIIKQARPYSFAHPAGGLPRIVAADAAASTHQMNVSEADHCRT